MKVEDRRAAREMGSGVAGFKKKKKTNTWEPVRERRAGGLQEKRAVMAGRREKRGVEHTL